MGFLEGFTWELKSFTQQVDDPGPVLGVVNVRYEGRGRRRAGATGSAIPLGLLLIPFRAGARHPRKGGVSEGVDAPLNHWAVAVTFTRCGSGLDR